MQNIIKDWRLHICFENMFWPWHTDNTYCIEGTNDSHMRKLYISRVPYGNMMILTVFLNIYV